jgi:hypothetical protein
MGFQHVPLFEFVPYFLAFLEQPHENTVRDLEFCQARWNGSGDPQWLLRLGHIFEGLEQYEQALQVFEYGQSSFPGRREFSQLANRAKERWGEGHGASGQ